MEKGRLKKAIALAGTTLTQIAEEFEVSTNTVWRWSVGENDPRDEIKKTLAQRLNTSIAYLMGETDDPTSPVPQPPVIATQKRKPEPIRQSNFVSLEDFARTREVSRNISSLDDRDLNAAEEMLRASLEEIERERAIRKAQENGLAG